MKKVIVVGGGSAGLSISAQLLRKVKDISIDLFEPSEDHYYQPLYTLVGAGVDPKEKTKRKTKDYLPKGVNWIKKRISSFQPDNNSVADEDGNIHSYDFLIVCPGLKIDWEAIEGLKDTLGKNGVCSVYGYQESEDTWKTIQSFKKGKAIFTSSGTPVKCPGASQKIMYLADAYFRKQNTRKDVDIHFITAGTVIFGVPGYKETLQRLIKEKEITTHFFHDLIKVDGNKKVATFSERIVKDGEIIERKEREYEFDFLHVVPHQCAPDFVRNSSLVNDKGWLDVDHFSLQHNKYSNIFGLGDVAGLPTAKTGAAIRKQAPVILANIQSLIENKTIQNNQKYNGYSACPVLTDYKHVLLAEFEYGNKPSPSFFFDTTKPRYSMYLLKHYFLPWFYWNRMLKGKG